MAFRQ